MTRSVIKLTVTEEDRRVAWLATAAVGLSLVDAAIPSPLGFGKLELASGRFVTGFLCESAVPEGSREITALGGWRAFLAEGASR